MKTGDSFRTALLAVLVFGVGIPAFSAAPVAGSGPSAGVEPPEVIVPGKDTMTCLTQDQDHDGWISLEEFKGLRKDEKTFRDEKAFRSADANRDGRLDLKECARSVGG